MTKLPKEKAREIVNSFLKIGMMIRHAKQCALICVDEMINEIGFYKDSSPLTYGARLRYLQKVKQKINNQ